MYLLCVVVNDRDYFILFEVCQELNTMFANLKKKKIYICHETITVLKCKNTELGDYTPNIHITFVISHNTHRKL